MPSLLPHERLTFTYFKNLFERNQRKADAYHILNAEEIIQISRIRRQALFLAALCGTLGVLILYMPVYIWGESIFWKIPLNIPFIGLIDFPLGFTLYGIVLAIIEIVALWLLNLRAVNRIAEVSGFPPVNDTFYERNIEMLFEISMEKPNTQILAYQINPLEGLTKWQILFFTAFNLLKATLSNMIVKFILGRVLARLALRFFFLKYLIDLISIPIFAFWDAYGTHRVIRQAKIRIMASALIHQITKQLHKDFKDDPHFIHNLLDALQLIAVAKRTFHHNHLILVESLLQKFKITPTKKPIIEENNLLAKIKQADRKTQMGLAKLFIFGLLIDGNLSQRERKILTRLNQENIFQLDFQTLKKWERSFQQGKGLDELFALV